MLVFALVTALAASPVEGTQSVWADATTLTSELSPTLPRAHAPNAVNWARWAARGSPFEAVGLAFSPLKRRESLTTDNGTTSRAVLWVEGIPIGEIAPMATARIHGVRAGRYRFELHLPDGTVRAATAESRP